jgi:hypothetical protein
MTLRFPTEFTPVELERLRVLVAREKEKVAENPVPDPDLQHLSYKLAGYCDAARVATLRTGSNG